LVDDVKDAVREFILAECLQGESPSNLRDDTPLRTGGIIDSLAILHLMSFVEEKFQIEVDVHEATTENFDTINRIAEFVDRKRAADN
jgi:acyl carrier protein